MLFAAGEKLFKIKSVPQFAYTMRRIAFLFLPSPKIGREERIAGSDDDRKIPVKQTHACHWCIHSTAFKKWQ
jgi:hypothetical protein